MFEQILAPCKVGIHRRNSADGGIPIKVVLFTPLGSLQIPRCHAGILTTCTPNTCTLSPVYVMGWLTGPVPACSGLGMAEPKPEAGQCWGTGGWFGLTP